MNFCGVDDQDDSMDSEELLSPNRNQMTYSCKYRLIIFYSKFVFLARQVQYNEIKVYLVFT